MVKSAPGASGHWLFRLEMLLALVLTLTYIGSRFAQSLLNYLKERRV
jgi:hypothetical protein